MAKDYLAMIADIEESGSTEYGRNVKRVQSPSVTPASILAASRYGSLTRGGLIAAFASATGCSSQDAVLVVDAYLEVGVIVGPDEDGLLRVRQ